MDHGVNLVFLYDLDQGGQVAHVMLNGDDIGLTQFSGQIVSSRLEIIKDQAFSTFQCALSKGGAHKTYPSDQSSHGWSSNSIRLPWLLPVGFNVNPAS